MKTLLALSLTLLTSIFGFSQTYYETSWISGEIKYTALVIFYEDSEALVRVKYYNNGLDKLANFGCSYKNFTKSDGTTDRYLDGTNASIIRGSSESSYSADNFYLKEIGNGNYKGYTVDDNGFTGGDITQYMKPMLYWVKLNPDALTKGYLDDYFGEEETIFQFLVFLNKGELSFPIKDNAVTVLANGVDQKSVWAAVMDKNSGLNYSEQRIKESNSYPSDWIKNQWDQGFYITSMDFDDNKSTFAVLMSKGYGLGPQSWKKSSTFPKDWITEKWNDNYNITSMTNGAGNWYVVMNKNTGFETQRWKTSYDIPRDWIIDNWNENYAITSATYGNGLWALSMSKGSKLGAQSWKTQVEYPFEWIQERADKGYSITSITYGDGMWLVVMSKNPSNTTNRSSTSYQDIPVDWIMKNAQY
ncbi:MAG: hypothetical protein CBB72_012225 [Muricauda sp. TMED12]|nr:MAG: hypothetical protein CBB72_012225 [Muricauda sp. TMED12]|tara:strand:- start:86843 stop:88090 length:1248 start_codon:yes stop_codon:yes gene_type:complete